jgi:hypothetical protein
VKLFDGGRPPRRSTTSRSTTTTAQDDAAAMAGHRKAAEQGHASAPFNLGIMYDAARAPEGHAVAVVSRTRPRRRPGRLKGQPLATI